MLHRINSDLPNRKFGAAILKMWLFDKTPETSQTPQPFGIEKKNNKIAVPLDLTESVVLDATSRRILL